MTEPRPDSPPEVTDPPAGRAPWLTRLAFALVLLLALAALLIPPASRNAPEAVFLVYDSSGDSSRRTQVYQPLQRFLATVGGRPLDLIIVDSVAAFTDRLREGASYVLCPDGLSLGVDEDLFLPLAVGRRPAPQNLRPRGVMVYRKAAGRVAEPWRDRPRRTVFGDSLSLVTTGIWRRVAVTGGESPQLGNLAFGPDPYDHAPVLHAARLGGFDYAIVRQWDAARFLQEGLLSPLEWAVEIMTVPVPDIVLMASKDLSGRERLHVGDRLASLGRTDDQGSPETNALESALVCLRLVGFNLLVEPDFDFVRRNFTRNWPPVQE